MVAHIWTPDRRGPLRLLPPSSWWEWACSVCGIPIVLLLIAIPAAKAQSADDLIGEYIVRYTASLNGSADMTLTSADGTLTQTETYSGTVQSETHYAVRLINSDGDFGSAEELFANSSQTVSGGGSADVTSKNDPPVHASWTFIPNPDFDSSIPYGTGALDSTSTPAASATGDPPWHEAQGPAWEMAFDAAYEAFVKARSFDFQVPSGRVPWKLVKSQTGTYTMSLMGGSASGSATCTATVEFVPLGLPKWEAVITPLNGYPAWMPDAGPNEATPGTNLLAVTIKIIPAPGNTNPPPNADFTVTLNDVTAEPGICLNYPSQRSAVTSKDLRILYGGDITVAADGQSASTETPVREVGVALASFDYGAFGKLKAVARTTDGQNLTAYVANHPDQYFLSVPKDDNNNRVADAWEIAEGVFNDNLAPEADCATEPSGHATTGDGIALYERYRGFRTLKGWVQLKARQKYVFVRDTDGLLLTSMLYPKTKDRSFPVVTNCKVLFIGEGQWTGPGPFKIDRIVNFNTSGFGHAVDQHALDLRVNDDPVPLNPAAWREQYNLDNPTEPISSQVDPEPTFGGSLFLGRTYRCLDAPDSAPDSPATTYRCVIFRANFINQALDMVRYHTRDLPQFRAYTDQIAWWAMSAEEQNLAWKAIDDAAKEYVANHSSQYSEWLLRMVGLVTTHELCHSLGTSDHNGLNDGSWNCVMRYFETGSFRTGDFPRTMDDRFELGLRKNWPSNLCLSGNGQPGGSCWKAVRVSDKP